MKKYFVYVNKPGCFSPFYYSVKAKNKTEATKIAEASGKIHQSLVPYIQVRTSTL
jgi:hypothetical protein